MSSSSFSIRTILTAVLLALLFGGASLAQAELDLDLDLDFTYINMVVIDKNNETNEFAQILEGEAVTLAWFGNNVEKCKIQPGNITADDTGLSPVYYDGSVVVTPDKDSMEYEINCQGVRDTVFISPEPMVSIEANYPEVELDADGNPSPGEPTITWNSKNVDRCGTILRKAPNTSYRGWKWHVKANQTEQRVDDNIVGTGTYEYQITCTGVDGRSISTSTTVVVTGVAQTATFTLTASPKSITANSNGQGAVDISWSGENLSRCNWRVYHDSPTVSSKSSERNHGDRTSGTVRFLLTEPGEHSFRLMCRSAVNDERIDRVATTTLSYASVALNEPTLTLTADPTAIELTPTDRIQSTLIEWSGGVVSRCDSYIKRKAPSEDDFRNYIRVRSLSGGEYDRRIAEPGTYLYKLTCYSAVDGSEMFATAQVNVGGVVEALNPAVNIDANPKVVTPDPSTGLAATTLTWSYENVLRSTCWHLDYSPPSRTGFYSLNDAPKYRTSGVTPHEGIDEYGTWSYRMQCDDPVTGNLITALEDVLVEEVELLPASMSLEARLVGSNVEIDYSTQHYTTCSAIEKRVLGSGWFEFDDASENVNTSGTLTDTSTFADGTYYYRLTCERPIEEDREDIIVAEVTYRGPAITGNASVGFAECRDAEGDAIATPAGYTVDEGGNCILSGVLGDINLSFESPLIRAGDTAQINWEYTGTYVFDACSLQGPGIIDPDTGNPTNSLLVSLAADPTGTAQTDPRYATSLYSLTCANAITTVPLASEEIRLEIVPIFQEV